MTNSPISSALAIGLIASRQLDNVPSAEPFRNNLFLSSLLCGNTAAQMVFNMRLADDLADVLKDRAQLQARLGTQRFVILAGPAITGLPEVGETLTAVPGRYEGSSDPNSTTRSWFFDGVEEKALAADQFTVDRTHLGKMLTLCEKVQTPVGAVTVTTAEVQLKQKP